MRTTAQSSELPISRCSTVTSSWAPLANPSVTRLWLARHYRFPALTEVRRGTLHTEALTQLREHPSRPAHGDRNERRPCGPPRRTAPPYARCGKLRCC